MDDNDVVKRLAPGGLTVLDASIMNTVLANIYKHF